MKVINKSITCILMNSSHQWKKLLFFEKLPHRVGKTTRYFMEISRFEVNIGNVSRK